MFWKFGGYASISPVDAILDRPDFTLEDLLDENDLLGDLKAQNNKLLDYLRHRDVLDRLLDYVVAPKLEPVAVPSGDETNSEDSSDNASAKANSSGDRARPPRMLRFGRPRASSSATTDSSSREEDDDDELEKRRNKYAFVACEILSSDSAAICEMLMDPSNRDLLHKFWQFLQRPVPLDPLQAGYFTKVNESLFDRRVDDMVEFVKSVDSAVENMVRHVDCPMIMDLLLKIITLDRPDAGRGIVEWLYSHNLIPTLLSFLSPDNSWATQTSAGDFIKAIITVSANATQNELTCIGPNELTRQLVSHPCIDELISYMLSGGNALTVGVGIVIEVIRKNNSDYDPDVGTEANSIPSGRDPIYLGTLLRMFAENVPNFMRLMNNTPAQKTRLSSTFCDKIEPLGFDRFKTCELMAELLHCSNMALLNEVGSEELIAARDAERKRLRYEGLLTRNQGEEAVAMPSTDLLTMKTAHSEPQEPSPGEGRRLEITNVSAADEDGFEEVTHSAAEPRLQNTASSDSEPGSSQSFLEKDEDDFVEEPLSSPRLHTHDDAQPVSDGPVFDDPDLVVAPLSPSKIKTRPANGDVFAGATEAAGATASTASAEQGSAKEVGDDFVTEANEPALGEGAKKILSDSDKGDDSESSIVFTPTISSLSDPLEGSSPRRSSSPGPGPLESAEKPADSTVTQSQTEETATSAEVAPLFTPSVKVPDSSAAESTAPEPAVPELTTPAAETAPDNKDSKESLEAAPAGDKAEEKATLTATAATTDDKTELDVTEMSVLVTDKSTGEPSNDTAGEVRFIDPVVGDFLKMQFVDHSVVPTILSFFFAYPWNNFLHNVVYDVVQQVFNGPMDRGFNPHLAISLFESADITTQIINGQLASEQSQAATRTRMGYMGHLTLIAEEVVKFTERHPPELLSDVVLDKVMSQDWINYVEGPLAETRERDNAILGGLRPDVAMGNQAAATGLAAVGLTGLGSSLGLSGSQGTSSALADAGLNGGLDFQGGNDGGLGPFSISTGISSGFHSSSDEEDDDVDDNDEDAANEFRAYTDPLNQSSSMLPPAIPPPPPPPPPLNIPPSRARLQLAARLAMNKRNAEAAAAQEGGRGDEEDEGEGEGDVTAGSGSKSLSSMWQSSGSAPERLRNPFADDEDDDDDAEDDDDDDDDDDELGLTGGHGISGGGGDAGEGTGRVGLGWNRGSWWRSMVRRDRNNAAGPGGSGSIGSAGSAGSGSGGSARDFGIEAEKFGDGRDSSSSGDEEEDDDRDEVKPGEMGAAPVPAPAPAVPSGDDVDDDDEEFGDFAMPEVSKGEEPEKKNGNGNGNTAASTTTPGGLFFDREPVLFKPLAVHPTVSPAGSGLWPFQQLGFLTAGAAATSGGAGSVSTEKQDASLSSLATSSLEQGPALAADGDLEVLGEDGRKISRVKSAKQRTSLEDPDEDEVVV